MLSILICVYNTDPVYLEECLKSIRRESISDIEICMLDDGSSIDYSLLVEKYGVRYKKTENRGIFSARLSAIEMAEGDYIAFFDSDDTVSFNYHLPMLNLAESEDADIVMNDWAFHTESSRYFCHSDPTVSGDASADGDGVISRFLSEGGAVHAYFVLWNKLYRRSLLLRVRDELLRVAEEKPGYNYSEDAMINFFAFRYAKKLRNLHTGYYFYRIHSSQSISVTGHDRLEMHIDCMSYTLDKMRDNLADHPDSATLIDRVNEWGAMMSRTHYSYALAAGHTDLYTIIKEKYGVKKLSRSTLRDARANSKNIPLPENFTEIDDALRRAWMANPPTRVAIFDNFDYTARTLRLAAESGREIIAVKPSENFDIEIPRARVSLKKRIIYSPIIYKTAMLLFRKGSRLRALLKKKM